MKKSGLLMLAFGVLFLNLGKNFSVKENINFNYDKYLKNAVSGGWVEDANRDGIYDYLFVPYDLSGNSRRDAVGVYRILFEDSEFQIIDENARCLYIDEDEDAKEEYLLIDRDNDGLLETKIMRDNHYKEKSEYKEIEV